MPMHRLEPDDNTSANRTQTSEPAEYPVREYIGAMALELAQMARWANDEALAALLDKAAILAAEAVRAREPEAHDQTRGQA